MKIYLIEEIDLDTLNKLKKDFIITNKLEEADIVISRNLYIDKNFIDRALNLKCIAIHGTGISECDLNYAKEKGIIVFNTPYQNYESVAELNIMLALLASRTKGLKRDLYGKTCAILGYGHIGKRTEELLKPFGVNILIYKRNNEISINEILKQSDYIFITMSLNDDTYHFIDKDKLKLMKKDAILINTARGLIVDENALLEALKNKELFCYASDVFKDEPLKMTNPLLKENVIAYPHIGSDTKDSLSKIGTVIYEGIMDFTKNKKPKYIL